MSNRKDGIPVIEIKMMKILKTVWKKNVFPKKMIILCLILSLSVFVFRFLSYYVDIIRIHDISFSNFIFPGVTGLSFSITLLNATRNLFDIKELVTIFEYTSDEDNDNCEQGDLFYRTLAPYMTSSILWLVISLMALISSLITVCIPVFFKEIFYCIFYTVVIAGLLNLWFLVDIHLKDIVGKINVELHKKEQDGNR